MRGNRLKSKTARVVLAVAVSGGLLALVLSGLELDRAAARLRAAEPGWILAAAGLSLGVFLSRGLRFASLLPRSGAPLSLAATGVQNFLNRVTPLRLGELSLPYLLRRHAGEDPAVALVAVVLVRLVDLAVVLAAVVLAVAMRAGAPGGLWGPALLLAGVVATLATFRFWLGLALRAVGAIARRFAFGRRPGVERVLAKLAGAVAESTSLGLRGRAVLLGWSLAVFVLQTAMFGALLRAFGVDLPVVPLVQGAAVAQVGAAVPVASVGTVGTQEASWVAGFVWAGVGREDALVTAIACQVITLAFAALTALPCWWWLGRRKAPAAPEPTGPVAGR
jgi:hypothetical protein